MFTFLDHNDCVLMCDMSINLRIWIEVLGPLRTLLDTCPSFYSVICVFYQFVLGYVLLQRLMFNSRSYLPLCVLFDLFITVFHLRLIQRRSPCCN